MPYKDKEKQREYQKIWVRNKFSDSDEREKLRERKRRWVENNQEKIRGYRHKSREKDTYRSKVGRQETENFIAEYKRCHPCVRCGESNPLVLEFHHREPKNKRYAISTMGAKGLKAVKREITKCDVVCANCHRIVHWELRNTCSKQ